MTALGPHTADAFATVSTQMAHVSVRVGATVGDVVGAGEVGALVVESATNGSQGWVIPGHLPVSGLASTQRPVG